MHITLRHLSLEDTEDLWSAICGPVNDHLWTWLKVGPFANIEGFRRNLQRYLTEEAAGKRAIYAIINPKSTRAVGFLGLDAINLKDATCELGPIIFGSVLQRSRAGTEANYLMMRYAFEECGFQRYEWTCDSLNVASRRAVERYGFVYEGCLRQNVVVKYRRKDTVYYSMLASEWSRLKKSLELWLCDKNFDGEQKQRKSLQEIQALQKSL